MGLLTVDEVAQTASLTPEPRDPTDMAALRGDAAPSI